MRMRFILSMILLPAWLAACAPAGAQPVFDLRPLPEATSIPMTSNPRVVATLQSTISSFDVSPDGKLIALATSGGVELYDLHTYEHVRSLNEGEVATRVAWSADGNWLAVGSTKDYGTPFFVGGDASNSNKARLSVWDRNTWKVIFEPEFGNEMVNQSFADLAWSPNGRALAFSTDLGGVQVLDTQSGAVLSRQTDFAATVTSISWSPDSSRLLANHDMGYAMRRWRLSDDQAIRLFDPRSSNFRAVAWSPDGTRIASGDGQGGVCLWTAATNRCDGFFRAHRTATFSLAWSPDGNQLATGGGVIRIWDTKTGQLIKGFGEDNGYIYTEIEWLSANGPLVSLETSIQGAGTTPLRLWDVSTGAVFAELRGQRVGQ